MVLDGIGLMGHSDHTPQETADLTTLPSQTKRAALLLHRLGQRRRRAIIPALLRERAKAARVSLQTHLCERTRERFARRRGLAARGAAGRSPRKDRRTFVTHSDRDVRRRREVVRADGRAARRVVRRARGRDLRPARPERRRQEHADSHPDGHHPRRQGAASSSLASRAGASTSIASATFLRSAASTPSWRSST